MSTGADGNALAQVNRSMLSAVLPHFAREFRLYLDQPLPPDVAPIPIPSGLQRAIPKRRVQYRAGRYCAMKAMEALGRSSPVQHVGRNDAGAPVWPGGLVGSITHTEDFASAAVASTSDAVAVGIDTERIMSDAQARNVGRIIGWPSEVSHGLAAGLSRLEALTLVFSAKESIFKCLYPMVACYFDFHDVRIVGVDGQDRTFTASIVKTLSDDFRTQMLLRGRFDVEAPWIHTGIALPTSASAGQP